MKYKYTILVVFLLIFAILLLPHACVWKEIKNLPLIGKLSTQATIPVNINITINSVCGNGDLEGQEQCDFGPYNGFLNGGCTTTCTFMNIPERDVCINNGGVWSLFPDSCVDDCEAQKINSINPPVACDATPTFGCSCQLIPNRVSIPDICWNEVTIRCEYPTLCPYLTPRSPNWCDNGVITPGQIINGCIMAPTCFCEDVTVLTPPCEGGTLIYVNQTTFCPLPPTCQFPISSGGGGGGIVDRPIRLPDIPIEESTINRCTSEGYLFSIILFLIALVVGVKYRKEIKKELRF